MCDCNDSCIRRIRLIQELMKNYSTIKGADTLHTPTENDLLVAMHIVYLVLLIVELFRYVDEQITHEDYTGQICWRKDKWLQRNKTYSS